MMRVATLAMLLHMFLWFTLGPMAVAQTPPPEEQKAPAEIPKGKLFGHISIVSNYLDAGLTQTENNPAIQSTVGFKWGAFKAGVWGSSVKYENSQDLIQLAGFGNYHFVVTQNFDLAIQISEVRYFNGGFRNGQVKTIDINMFKYHVVYRSTQNWEGTTYDQLHFGGYREWNIKDSYFWKFDFGYNSTDAPEVASYFDTKTSLFHRKDGFTAEIALSLTSYRWGSNPRSGPYILLGMHATFN
jgi:uncharacterized protein (TIGR02001 family)